MNNFFTKSQNNVQHMLLKLFLKYTSKKSGVVVIKLKKNDM